MFHVVTGDGWPAVDEDQIHDLGRLWLQMGAHLAEYAPQVTRAAQNIADAGALLGQGQQALAAAVAVVTGEGDLRLEKLAVGFEELGRYLQQVAAQTQYMKIVVIEELVILAAEIAYLIAMIPWTFGASAAGIAAVQVFGRQFAVALLRQLAIAVATGEVLQVGLDAVAQLAQLAQGRRTGGQWGWDLTESAAITGVMGGLGGPVFHALGHYPGRLLGKSLGAMVDAKTGHQIGDWAADTVKGAGHEYITDGASAQVQGGGWNPDTFSPTAGATDEAITTLAATGRHKRTLTLNHTHTQRPGTTPHIPDHLHLPHTSTAIPDTSTTATSTATTGAGAAAGGGQTEWLRSTHPVVSHVRRTQAPDLTGFWDPGPTHPVTVHDTGTHQLDGTHHHDAGTHQQVAPQQELARTGEVPTDHATTSGPAPDPVPGADPDHVAAPEPIEVDAAQTFTLDDLDPVPRPFIRRTDEQKLALLADYERAISQHRGNAWLREHGFSPARISQWRRLRATSALPAGDPLLAGAKTSSLSLAQKTALVRDYQDAVSHGQGQQWLTERNLARRQVTLWETLVRTAQQQPVQPTASNPDPSSVAGPSSTGPVAVSGPVEVEVGPPLNKRVKRSNEEKLALLADYEQAASQRKGHAWLRRHGFNPGRINEWRRLQETSELPAHGPRLEGSAPSSLSLAQKADLVRDYQDAVSHGQGQQWLTDRNLTRIGINRWKRLVRSAQQQPARPTAARQAVPGDRGGESEILVDPIVDFGHLLSPTDHATTSGAALSPGPDADTDPGPGPVAVPGPIEVDAAQTFTLDDLEPVPSRRVMRSDEEKLALLADFERAASQRRGQTWLRERAIHPGRVTEWRRLRATAELRAGDPLVAGAASSSLSLPQKAALVRDYQDAVSHGQGQQWLTNRNLTRHQVTRWQTLVRSAQQRPVQPTAAQPAVPGDRGGESEILVDPIVDFGHLLSPTDHATTSGAALSPGPDADTDPGPGPVAVRGPIEVEPGQAFTLDDLGPVAIQRVMRTDEEKLALLAEYEQAASQLRGRTWLREHGIRSGRVAEWRRLRETSALPARDPLLAGAAPSSLSWAQKTALVRDYQDAVSHGQGQQWLTQRNLSRIGMNRWAIKVAAAMGDGTAADGGQSQPETGAQWPRAGMGAVGMGAADVGPSHREAVPDDQAPQQGSAPQHGSLVPPRWDGDFGYSPLENIEMTSTIDEILRGLEDVPRHDPPRTPPFPHSD